MTQIIKELSAKPLTNLTWLDFEKLFGNRGACGGCWCMTWRLASKVYEKMKGEGSREAMANLVSSGNPIGIMAYVDSQAVGWCSISPREKLPRLENSSILARIDEQAVWSLACFFVKKEFRNKGISKFLIRQAVQYALSHGPLIIEAYPIEPKKINVPPVFAFTGLASAFEHCGFEEVVRRSETRPIMRWKKP